MHKYFAHHHLQHKYFESGLEGKKSYAISFTLKDDTKTLTDKQIDKIMNKLQQKFENEIGAELR